MLEVYLFGFDKEIYGTRVCIEFIEKIREIQKFDSLDKLKENIQRDCDQAKSILELTNE